MSVTKTSSPANPDPIAFRSIATDENSAASLPDESRAHPSRVAVVGNYLPRRCGIATFTTDLCDALGAAYGELQLLALPVNDTEEGYSYPERVRFELSEANVASYQQAAEFLNFSNIDVVCLQHEYGIFGGRAGGHVLQLLRRLHMPVVTTLHTVLPEPNPEQRAVLEEISELSERLIVMSRHAAEILHQVYRVPAEKIDIIPHGVPDLPFMDSNFYKESFGTEGKTVLLTFGLISPNKGMENVVQALPRILSRHNVVYVVAGATHPHVQRRDGESYRHGLQRLAVELGVEDNVIFYDRFFTPKQMMEIIGSADIYITPYKYKQQAVSGTLAYALSAGKAIISTPYLYAAELLAEERGVLVPFDDSQAIAEKAIELLDDDPARHAMRKRAYLYSRDMVWSNVAERYMQCIERVYNERMLKPQTAVPAPILEEAPEQLPAIKLDHLYRLTDETGIIEHAVFVVPNYREGYTTDDNARALIVAVMMNELEIPPPPGAPDLASRYLAFLWHAFDPETKRFRNGLNYARQWEEPIGSEDSHGRALWGLGTVLGRSKHPGLRGAAGRLLESAIPPIVEFTSPRAWAYSVLGLHEYLGRFPGDTAALNAADVLANRLLGLYRDNRLESWHWFEGVLAYSNARLSQALIRAGSRNRNEGMLTAGLESLDWLTRLQRSEEKGHFVPIGSQGFYTRAAVRARFDQQPVEAGSMVSACLEAYGATHEARWRREAWSAFNWFLGRNDKQIALYDPGTGGCRDGLHPDRANENQGAESTLSFLMALLEMRRLMQSNNTESQS